MRIGVVGCGNICGIYFQNLTSYAGIEVVSCADLDLSRAQAASEKYGISKAYSVDELLADPDVDIVVNLTVPKAHYSVSKAALEAGKHVYNEKPFAVDLNEGAELVALANSKGLKTGCAPDTVLGAGIQTCRELIDSGAIGSIVGANAFMLCPGHESWHPDPGFYYEVGGGPLFDMGPYYLSALVTLMGPIAAVNGLSRVTSPTRTITSEPKRGTIVPVETPTHIVCGFEFASGAIGQFTASFDVQRSTLPHIEVYGTEGTILVPDPNGFGGPVKLFRKGGDWEDVPVTRPYSENSRGLGVLDMANAIREGRAARASGELGLHVLEAMHGVLAAAESGSNVRLRYGADLPAAMPT